MKKKIVVLLTKNIQSIVYNLLKRLDYSKYGEKQIEVWGENYVRKYGRADVELKVLIDSEHRFELLDRKFIEKEILPALYVKCYNSDLEEDILLIKSKSVLSTISSEILEKVRLLNLYQIRYGTLFDLAYDLAIQPPHHWFTDDTFRSKHLSYNLEAVKRHYNDFVNDKDIKYSSKEFIEHSSAIILSFYSLFIGIGKLRPLISLLNYLKLKEKYKIWWETSELSNFKADLNATDVPTNFNNFKMILDKIKYKIGDVSKNKNFLIEKFKIVYEVVNGLVKIQNEINRFSIKSNSQNEFKGKVQFLLKFFDNIFIKNDNILIQEFKNNIFNNKLYSDIKLFYFYEENDGNYKMLIPDKIINSNSILIISNKKKSSNFFKSILNKHNLIDEYVFYFTIDEIFKIVKSKNRCNFLEHSLYESSI